MDGNNFDVSIDIIIMTANIILMKEMLWYDVLCYVMIPHAALYHAILCLISKLSVVLLLYLLLRMSRARMGRAWIEHE